MGLITIWSLTCVQYPIYYYYYSFNEIIVYIKELVKTIRNTKSDANKNAKINI